VPIASQFLRKVRSKSTINGEISSPPMARDDAAYRPKHRFGQGVQGSQNRARDRIVSVDDAETDKPAGDHRRNDNPPIEIQDRQQQQSECSDHWLAPPAQVIAAL
jgi:hypothetical protein